MIRRILFSSLLCLVACQSGPGNVVDLTIVADSSVMLTTVRTLTLASSGVQSKTRSYPLPTGLPKQETLQLLPTVTSGMLTVTATAFDGNMVPVAQGMKSVALTGKELALSVTLTMVAPPTVTVTPATAKVTVGKTTTFSANRAVTWSVMGGDANGTVDASGVYTAPLTAGAYTVVATDKMDPAAMSTATVTAVDYQLELLAGQLGGMGEFDAVGGAARFTRPFALATDGAGNLYVGDRYNGCTLHKINLTTQAVTIIGGKGNLCRSVDGKLGSTALFDVINSMAYDATDNSLFIGAYTVVRKVLLATGDVTTLSNGGGPLLFDGNLDGLAYDSTANVLYAANNGTHTIDKVTLGAPPVATIFAGMQGTAGSTNTPTGPATSANFNQPSGLAVDAAGANLYVADTGNSIVRKIVIASGVTSTLAGTPGQKGHLDGTGAGANFSQPFALVPSASGTTLYVTENDGQSVRSVAVANGSVATLAGRPKTAPAMGMPLTPTLPVDGNGSQAVFGNLGGIAIDPNTNALYVADYSFGTIRQVQAFGAGSVQTFAGTPPALGSTDGVGTAARFWSIGSMTSDGSAVYLADNGNATIRKYDLVSGAVTTIAGQAGLFGGDDGHAATARFERPEGLFVDGSALYISDGGGATIRKLDLMTNQVTTIAGKHLAIGSSDGTGSAARFGYPLFITGDHNDHLFVSDSMPALRRVTISTGAVATVAGQPLAAGHMDGAGAAAKLGNLAGLAVEGGLLYFCDSSPGVFVGLRTMTLDTFTVATVAGSAAAGLVDGKGAAAQLLALNAAGGDGKGHVYFGDSASLRRFDVATGMVTTVVGKAFQQTDAPGPLATALVGSVNGVTVLPSGDVVFNDAYEDVILQARLPPAP